MAKVHFASMVFEAGVDNTFAGSTVRPTSAVVSDYLSVDVPTSAASGYYIPYVDMFFSVGVTGAAPTYSMILIPDTPPLPVPQNAAASVFGINNITDGPFNQLSATTARHVGVMSGSGVNFPLSVGHYVRLRAPGDTPVYCNSRRIYFNCFVSVAGTAFTFDPKVVISMPFVSVSD